MLTPSTIFFSKRIVRLAYYYLGAYLSHILRQTMEARSHVASDISNGNALGEGEKSLRY